MRSCRACAPTTTPMIFRHRPAQMRLVAKTMLALWLLGVLAGAANACVLQDRDGWAPPLHHEGSALWHHHVDDVAPATSAAGETGHADDCDQGAGEHACRHLCDATAGAVVKTTVLDIPAGTPLFAAIATWAPYPPQPAPTAWPVRAALPPPGPAVAILFLRLTI